MHFSALVEKGSYCMVLESTWTRRGHRCRDCQPLLGVLFDVETHNQVILYKILFEPHLDRQLKGKGQRFSFSSGMYIYPPHKYKHTLYSCTCMSVMNVWKK